MLANVQIVVVQIAQYGGAAALAWALLTVLFPATYNPSPAPLTTE